MTSFAWIDLQVDLVRGCCQGADELHVRLTGWSADAAEPYHWLRVYWVSRHHPAGRLRKRYRSLRLLGQELPVGHEKLPGMLARPGVACAAATGSPRGPIPGSPEGDPLAGRWRTACCITGRRGTGRLF